MPKIVAGSNNWQAVEVPGELANDENFAFLASFEECLPMEIDRNNCNDQSMSKKKAKKRKANADDKDMIDESDLKNENVQSVRKKKGKRMKLKKSNESEVSVTNIEKTDDADVIPRMDTSIEGNDIEGWNEDKEETSISSGWTSIDISDAIMRAIIDMGFTEPTEIQRLVIPGAVRDRLDIIGAAETGSGKTLAFGVPVIERLLAMQQSVESGEPEKSIRALILAPTRELVMQIKNHIQALLKYTPFRVASIVGGLSLQKQERILKYVPEVVIATPGRFLALMKSAQADSCLSNWSQLQCLVVDETDRMIEKGHFQDLQQILSSIRKNVSEKLQTFVFSATLTYTHPTPRRQGSNVDGNEMSREDKIERLIEITGIRKEKYRIIDITADRGTAETVVEARMNCKNLLEKDTSLVYLLKRYAGRTLVFTNSVDASRRLHGILMQLEHKPIPLILHAKMTQKKRLNNLEKFTKEENSVLLATDVAARGLDIRDVQHVIHYQVPKTAELYIHRCGRTARATKKGLAVLLVDPQDVRYYQRICRNLNREKELPVFPVDAPELYSILKERVEVAVAVEALEHRLKKMQSKQTWFEKAAASADLDLDESEFKRNAATEMSEDLRREKKALLIKLRHLLSQPLPASSIHVKKTRYVTAEMASNYGKSSTQDAIASLEENAEHEELLRKKCRTVFVRHLKKKSGMKVKKKKMKRR